ncbi:MAG: 23S rRNA (adenine(2030)-N(6))-methyltransferase RlmJ [Candidatus Dactylopiibacterium sp.]|nr:23S rRNA (adenine(2030)-N(6))-methyltransferase RlmJ [Candidatus Dactylopiibacterium sp.]
MLSYRHSYHAGNHADVLKHTLQIQLLRHLAQKDKAFWVIDTHAGAGLYALDSVHAEKLGEYRDGIGRLWSRSDLPEALAEYVAAVRELNPDGSLRAYPGSPWLSQRALREQDRLRLFELHSTDFRTLEQTFGGHGKQALVYADDGFARLKALLPPPSRRALTLIDPSYELREDYTRLVDTLRDALQRFPTGTYAIWYPMLSRPESRQLVNHLKALGARNWLHAALAVRGPSPDGMGMHGSGMFVINPPWTLAATLEPMMPWLVDVLGTDPGARHILEHQAD